MLTRMCVVVGKGWQVNNLTMADAEKLYAKDDATDMYVVHDNGEWYHTDWK